MHLLYTAGSTTDVLRGAGADEHSNGSNSNNNNNNNNSSSSNSNTRGHALPAGHRQGVEPFPAVPVLYTAFSRANTGDVAASPDAADMAAAAAVRPRASSSDKYGVAGGSSGSGRNIHDPAAAVGSPSRSQSGLSTPSGADTHRSSYTALIVGGQVNEDK